MCSLFFLICTQRKACKTLYLKIQLNVELINNIRFADDILVIAQTGVDLQRMVDKIVNNSKTLTMKKTKFIFISKAYVQGSLYIRKEKAETVRAQIPGYYVQQDWKTLARNKIIGSRIGQARELHLLKWGRYSALEI